MDSEVPNDTLRPERSDRRENLGWFLRRARKERNFTQGALAKQVDISLEALSEIERGATWPSMALFLSILDALDLSRWDPTDPVNVVHSLRRERSLHRLGLLDWMLTLTDDEMILFSTRGYEAVELGRAMGVLHGRPLPTKGEPLPLLFPEHLSGFRSRAQSEDGELPDD